MSGPTSVDRPGGWECQPGQRWKDSDLSGRDIFTGENEETGVNLGGERGLDGAKTTSNCKQRRPKEREMVERLHGVNVARGRARHGLVSRRRKSGGGSCENAGT